ncbi:hypothetical protein RND71_025628 [Anisodus tanguticus]|uniref:FBD domain-containing protein n=1 Tax=Anisodus tanguticus TaxID=243964 RepID=A0AAE1RTD6_9SOLA|nr:hypothetical protein RND71_025628 [Anisodus tanguticus]
MSSTGLQTIHSQVEILRLHRLLKIISLKNVPHLAEHSLLYGESPDESEKCDLDNFFGSHPALEHLRLEYGSVQVSMDESDEEVSSSFSDVMLNHVRTVKVEGITSTKFEIQLIRLLLAKSPMLVRMPIEPDLYWVNKEKGVKILAELSTFQRASRKAEIKCQLERKQK